MRPVFLLRRGASGTGDASQGGDDKRVKRFLSRLFAANNGRNHRILRFPEIENELPDVEAACRMTYQNDFVALSNFAVRNVECSKPWHEHYD